MNKPVKPLILTKRWNHHTRSGGYDKLADYLPGDKIITGKSKTRRTSFAFKIWKKLVPSSNNVNHYLPADFISEIKGISKVYLNRFNIAHALYAEDQLNFLLKFRKYFNCMLIGTFHLPIESVYVQKAISAGHYENFKNLDAAIVVSKSMVNDLEEWVGKNKVYVVPHGIDTNIFSPTDVARKRSDFLNLLSVGYHGRDWETMLEVISHLQGKTDHFNYHVVTPENQKEKFTNKKNVIVHSNIPEKKLVKLYQEADVLLLPVRFGTANNSILESLACGTPVISSDVGGISEYVDESAGWLFNDGDAAGISVLIEKMLEDPSLYLAKRSGARKKALSFDWKIIAGRVQEVYSDTLMKQSGRK